MSSARDVILQRIRDALADVPSEESPADVPVARDYRCQDPASGPELIERLAASIRDYRATVRIAALATLADEIASACAELRLRRLVIPPALPGAWRPATVELVEDHGLGPEQLDGIDGALTGCAAAIAQTGTIVLDGSGPSGRRAITLVPDHHVCVVTEEQIVGSVPEAIARVRGAVADQRLPITLISGPSATSDIELKRVEGVHGPRHLLVLIATG